MNYFELFEIPVSFFPDPSLVSKKYLMLQKKFHPDFYANASADEQSEALALSSMANKALQVLKDPALVLPYILEINELLSANENYQLPPHFLMEVMDLNEQVMEVTDDTQKTLYAYNLNNLRMIFTNLLKGCWKVIKWVLPQKKQCCQ